MDDKYPWPHLKHLNPTRAAWIIWIFIRHIPLPAPNETNIFLKSLISQILNLNCNRGSMSSSNPSPGLQPPPKVTINTFMVGQPLWKIIQSGANRWGKGLIWGGVALTLLFFAFRIYLRIKSFHRLFWDDLLVLMAWLMILANAIIWHYAKDGLYLLMNIQSGRQLPPRNFGPKVGQYLHHSIAILVLFYSSLWCVKLSFLIFFRGLGQNLQRQKKIWWSILALVVVSYFSVLGTIQWHCSILRFEVIER